jgi:hypothetical protein
LYQCHFIHHKSKTDWPGITPGLPCLEACNLPPESWHGHSILRNNDDDDDDIDNDDDNYNNTNKKKNNNNQNTQLLT